MDTNTLLSLILRMREAQKKATSDLTRRRAAELERQVDDELRKIFPDKKQHKNETLF